MIGKSIRNGEFSIAKILEDYMKSRLKEQKPKESRQFVRSEVIKRALESDN
jgi:hypothetical protein